MRVTAADRVKTKKSMTALEKARKNMLTSPSVGLFLSLIHAGHQLLCDVQLTPLPSPSITAVAAGRGEGERSGLASWVDMKQSDRAVGVPGSVCMSLFACVSV